jgi:hypothetical protein
MLPPLVPTAHAALMSLEPAQTMLAALADSPSLRAGALCYAGSLCALLAWEAWAVPPLKRVGVLPDVPSVPGALSERQRAQAFVVPLTADQSLPLPTWDALVAEGRHRVGRVGGVTHYILPGDVPAIRGVQEPSEPWSAHYGARVSVLKSVRRLDAPRRR